jgi:hypothetical protein
MHYLGEGQLGKKDKNFKINKVEQNRAIAKKDKIKYSYDQTLPITG